MMRRSFIVSQVVSNPSGSCKWRKADRWLSQTRHVIRQKKWLGRQTKHKNDIFSFQIRVSREFQQKTHRETYVSTSIFQQCSVCVVLPIIEMGAMVEKKHKKNAHVKVRIPSIQPSSESSHF